MKKSIASLIITFLSMSAYGERFQSKIHSFELDRTPHIVKFENGRVAFLNSSDKSTFHSLKEGLGRNETLEIEVDRNFTLKGVQTVADDEDFQDVSEKSLERMSYDPTVLADNGAAKTIFKRMRKNYQRDSQCYNRAHVWTYEEFKRTGLNSVKLFMFFTSRYIRNYRYKWWFHVTPMTRVWEGGVVVDKVLDRTFTNSPRSIKAWTDDFIHSHRTCPIVTRYSQYSTNQQSQDCYLIPVTQFFWQPRDIEQFEITGREKTSYIPAEVSHAYWEAF